MENLKELVNEEVGLEVINEEGEKEGPSYNTKIVEVFDADDISILAPTFDKYTVPLPIDTKVKIILETTPERENFINGIIVSKSDSENQILLRARINRPKLKKTEINFSVKTDCGLKAEYSEVDLAEEHEFIFAKVINMSTEGLSLLTNEEIALNKLLEVYIWIDAKKIVNAICNVAQKRGVTSIEGFKYKLMLRFTEISESDKDIIIKYIFKRQKEYIKGIRI